MRAIPLCLTVVLALGGTAAVEAQSAAATPGGRLFRPPPAAAIADHYLVLLANQAMPSNQVESVATTLVGRYGGVLTHLYRNAVKGFAVRIAEPGAVAMSADPLVES